MKSIQMYSFIKKYWLCLILLIVTPIIINIIVLIPTPFPSYTADGSSGWLGFFASYIGSIIPFVILFFTLRDNHQENEKNRNLQVRTIEYQVEKDGLTVAKQAIIGYIQSLHIYELGFIPHYPKQYVNDTLLKLKQISESAVFSFEQMDFALADFNDDKDVEYRSYFVKINLEYQALIKDFAWILDFYLPQNAHLDVINKLKEYKELNTKVPVYFDDKKRVWNFIQDDNYDIINNGSELMEKLLDSFDFRSIKEKTREFIKYERSKIKNNLINLEK